MSVERRNTIRIGWFAISAAGLVLAVMTKGIAGAFALAGLFAFSLVSGRLVLLLNNLRVWLLAIVALTLWLDYYGSREAYDPGYLQAIMGQRTHQLPGNTRGTSGRPSVLRTLLALILRAWDPIHAARSTSCAGQ